MLGLISALKKIAKESHKDIPPSDEDKCLSCGAWGLSVVKENGYCNYCNLQNNKSLLKTLLTVQRKTGEGGNAKSAILDILSPLKDIPPPHKDIPPPHMGKCLSCGAWGLSVVKESGFCNYCEKKFDSNKDPKIEEKLKEKEEKKMIKLTVQKKNWCAKNA